MARMLTQKYLKHIITKKAYEADAVRFEILKHFGYFVTESPNHMSEYVPYFRKNPEMVNRFLKRRWDYLEICKQTGKEPFKSYKGSFNIRITPDLHKKAVQKSISRGVSLNQFVQEAIEHEVSNSNID